jgi:hypothetical protein
MGEGLDMALVQVVAHDPPASEDIGSSILMVSYGLNSSRLLQSLIFNLDSNSKDSCQFEDTWWFVYRLLFECAGELEGQPRISRMLTSTVASRNWACILE